MAISDLVEHPMKNSTLLIGIIAIIAVVSAGAVIITMYQPDDGLADQEYNNNNDLNPNVNFSSDIAFHESANDFAFELLKEFDTNDEYQTNAFFSPYSIFTALAMTYEGAENNTAAEMAATLNIPQDNESFHTYVSNLYTTLNTNTDYNISTANALWIKTGYQLLEDYLADVQTHYHAESTNIDFSDPENAAAIINNWIENETNNLIQDLISPDNIDPALTRLILTNAIYFKGIWKIQFDEANTTDRPFTLTNGEQIDVETMTLIDTDNTFNYTETETLQLLSLPYEGDDLSMMILLPKEETTLSTMIADLTEKTYYDLLDDMTQRNVDIYLPSFNVSTPQYKLSDMLINMGIKDAFTYDADFSGITGSPDLFIKHVLHKAFVSVNEEGTEAAAATGVVMDFKAAPGAGSQQIVFDCDHPFLYLIQHQETGTILFMGTMDNPNLEA